MFYTSYEARSIQLKASQLWIELPEKLKAIKMYLRFKKHLKEHFLVLTN